MSDSESFSVVRQIRARIIPEILSLPARLAQLRGMTRALKQSEPSAEEASPASAARPKRRRLLRDTALLAAKSLRAPIIDR